MIWIIAVCLLIAIIIELVSGNDPEFHDVEEVELSEYFAKEENNGLE